MNYHFQVSNVTDFFKQYASVVSGILSKGKGILTIQKPNLVNSYREQITSEWRQ